jgi:hypothetical protein
MFFSVNETFAGLRGSIGQRAVREQAVCPLFQHLVKATAAP